MDVYIPPLDDRKSELHEQRVKIQSRVKIGGHFSGPPY